jgi:NAD(P)-dependent dehydrogenase (short-subunit alcohol dehydrogenase family)
LFSKETELSFLLENTQTSEIEATIRRLGRKVLVCRADVSQPQQVAKMFEDAVKHFGRIDIVCANAAFSIRSAIVDSEWKNNLRTIEVTQFGVFHTCQAAARQMLLQTKQV